MWVSHFSHLSVFPPYSRSYSVRVSFQVFPFSRHIPVPTVYISPFFHIFHCFSPYSRSYHMIFSFYLLVSFLAIFQVLQCTFSFLTSFSVPCHRPGLTMWDSHFPCWSEFFSTIQFLYWIFLIFYVSHCFSPYSRSYSVCFSFSMIFSFLTIVQVLQCAFPLFHVFLCFSLYSRSYRLCVSFSTFFSFLTIFHVLHCTFLIFHVFLLFPAFFQVLQCVCVSFSKFFSFLAIL